MVESLLDQKTAILKRPNRSAFPTDVLRQASQISREGDILRALAGIGIQTSGGFFHLPKLLDSSKPGSEYSERFFIVLERAEGIDLNSLQRLSQGAEPRQFQLNGLQDEEYLLLESFQKERTIPTLLLLRALVGLLDFLEHLHHTQFSLQEQEYFGVLWNDIKPEHIFWAPARAKFNLIDWGNAQPLGADGTSRDRRFSLVNDYQQIIQSLGPMVAEVNPDLYAKLEWPVVGTPASIYSQGILQLKEQLNFFLVQELSQMRAAQEEEDQILSAAHFDLTHFQRLETLQQDLCRCAEFPNWKGAERAACQLAGQLVTAGERAVFLELCQRARSLPSVDLDRWELIHRIGNLYPWPGLFQTPAQNALIAALENRWDEVLWQLRLSLEENQLPPWWPDLSDRIRRAQLNLGSAALSPLVVLNRVILTLQAEALKPGRAQNGNAFASSETASNEIAPANALFRTLKENLARRWVELEPDPPGSGIDYGEIEDQLDAIGKVFPAGKEMLAQALEQPKAVAAILLEAWNRKDFDTARRGLRRLFLWDPDRQRLLTADKAIVRSPQWLEGVRSGPSKDETLVEFTTRYELRGREMRNCVGSSAWLDSALDAFTRLRKGASPADILLDYPELRSELPWLVDYHPPLLETNPGPVLLERLPHRAIPSWLLKRNIQDALGANSGLVLGESLDTWTPEARGSSARVFLGQIRGEDHSLHEAAIKMMRPGKSEYALPLFREEAQVLSLMNDTPGVPTPLEVGFIQLEDGLQLPSDAAPGSAAALRGQVLRISPAEIRTFLSNLELRPQQGWLPYLAFPLQERKDNLMFFCDAGRTHGKFLSLKSSLRLAIQILDILQTAHARNVVYRDHKILHYYWLERENGVTIIDWNVARHAPEGLTLAERRADLVQFGARALHHILTGRPAPGALPLGPTRPEEIEAAAQAYSPQWNFDDQRLPTRLREIVERALVGHYDQVSPLRQELLSLFHDLPDPS